MTFDSFVVGLRIQQRFFIGLFSPLFASLAIFEASFPNSSLAY